jgi:flagellar biosynthesis protein FlhA
MSATYAAENYPDWMKNTTLLVAAGVIGILLVMMIPLPTIILDILLTMNITLSIIVLLMCMYVMKPLDFSVFPSVLLVLTLLRLSLNVASTRLILLHGSEGTSAAGQVIKAFGTFVVGGNYVVGMIVFLVLVLINFVVITKGATRIAEVAARFTLDAMPGKQMSIDADLNAGLITDAMARVRRRDIEREADFYGAMDGASKFVRGDAIAGIVIVFVNIIGGLIIGVVQQNMNITTAAHNYTLLTIGDGLVTQIPALIVSTAAGMLVTRSTASTNLGAEITGQLLLQPRAIATASVMLLVFGLIPGMPKLSFFLISLATGGLAYNLFQIGKKDVEKEKEKEPPPLTPRESVEALLPLDILELEVGYGLISLVDAEQGGELLERIRALRKQIALEMGIIVPAIHIRDNLQLKANAYSIFLKGIEIAKGEVMPGYYMAINSDERVPKLKGIEAREPAFGLPAVWISEQEKESVQAKGYVVVDPATVVTTHLTEVIKNHADELLTREEVRALIDTLAVNYPKMVEELVPAVLNLGLIQKVLQRLLRERISIRDLFTIIEVMADYAPITKNVDIITGYVRQALARTISKQYRDGAGNITVATVSPAVEDSLSRCVQHTDHESYAVPDPDWVQKLIGSIQKLVNNFTTRGLQPIILCSPQMRPHFRKIIERFYPNVVVLSNNEIARDVSIRSLGMVEI